MELTAYLRVIRRRWRLVMAVALLGALAGAGSYLLQPKQSVTEAGSTYYKATHTLLGTKEVNLSQVAAITTTGDVPRRVADRLGGSPGLLASSTVAVPVPQANLLQITSFSTDPSRAAQSADAFAEELVRYQTEVQDRTKQAAIDALEQRREGLRAAYEEVLREGSEQTDPSRQDEYRQRKDDLVRQGQEIEKQIEAAKNQPPSAATLTSLSTADPQPTTAQAMTQALDPQSAGKSSASSASDASALDSQVRPAKQLGLVPRAGLGLGIGLLLGIGLTILIERLDPRIRTKEQAEVAYGWPVIAEVPPLTRRQQKEAEVLVFTEPRSRTAEAFRVLRSAVLFASDTGLDEGTSAGPSNGRADTRNGNGRAASGAADGRANGASRQEGDADTGARVPSAVQHEDDAPKDLLEVPITDSDRPVGALHVGPSGSEERASGPGEGRGSQSGDSADSDQEPPAPPDDRKRGRVILITSPGPAEGKTTTASNLAGAVAETGFRVLVINCDFRRPRLAAFFHREPGPGAIVTTSIGGVDILNEVIEGAATKNPATVLAAQRKAIHDHVHDYDVIVLDTAPMLTTNDAVDVLVEADSVLVVGRAGKTTREAADRAAESLDRRNAPVIGVVLAGAADSPSGRYYYYGGKDGYYLSRRRGSKRSEADADAGKEMAEADDTER